MTTNAPIEPRHKDEAAKAAGYRDWTHGFGTAPDQNSAASLRAHAQTLANLEVARADLAEIDDRAQSIRDWRDRLPVEQVLNLERIARLAAPYRASDPVAEALKAEAMAIVLAESITRTDHQIEAIRNGHAGQGKIDLVMTALKRGMELASKGDR